MLTYTTEDMPLFDAATKRPKRIHRNSRAAYRSEGPVLSRRAMDIIVEVRANGPGTDRQIMQRMGFREPTTCGCTNPRPVPATVLDPFGGIGTSGQVALALGRNAILCELNEKYAAIARRRLADESPLFTSQEAGA